MRIEFEFTVKVSDLINEIASQFGSLKALERKAAAANPSFAVRAAMDDLRRYRSMDSNGQVQVRKALVFHDSVKFLKLLSPERIRLLDALRHERPAESIHELAIRLRRDPKNVHQDVKILEKRGLVEVQRRNRRRSVPRPRVQNIVITV